MAKRLVLSFILCLGIVVSTHAQQTRYFQFFVECGHGNWQDTSFIAATNNPAVIDSVLANLSRPLEERQFINGEIAAGHGGHNHNASHWFNWHFVPNEWSLVDLAIEVCDGCPYSDIDADTTYWLHTVGQFCPWGSRPLQEVSAPTTVRGVDELAGISVYPNPAVNSIFINHAYRGTASITLYDVYGIVVYQEANFTGKMLNVRPYSEGMYWLTIVIGDKSFTEKVLVRR